jgi:hypothetical protein
LDVEQEERRAVFVEVGADGGWKRRERCKRTVKKGNEREAAALGYLKAAHMAIERKGMVASFFIFTRCL